MKFKSQNDVYQIEIPDEYEHEENENTLSIYRSNGVGVITISGYSIPSDYDFIIKDELIDFIHSIDDMVVLDSINTINCENEFCSHEFIDNIGRFWRVWIYFENNNSAFISYNCDNEDKNIEMDDVENIVKSIVLNS